MLASPQQTRKGSEDRLWPISEVAARLIKVRSVGHSGRDLLTLSSSHFDPLETWRLMDSKSPGDGLWPLCGNLNVS
jgi:hypothetical protein